LLIKVLKTHQDLFIYTWKICLKYKVGLPDSKVSFQLDLNAVNAGIN